uniref:ARAD1C00484p n=1 Tax=Blastobotrys adeninivorans TaxID=409370 RepID=A0A060SYE4_BLAAD
MAKAEVGTPKYVANQMKAKGLQRLRWYCQICEKQCRDENGFKCHVSSESHVRKALEVGEKPSKAISNYSSQFQSDFLRLLRTAHGEKKINANRFYQEYIQDKHHIHMNATRWVTLSQFVKHLGREGLVRVEESEKDGLCIAWIDNSPETLMRQEALRAKERREKGDEETSQRILEQQIKLANEQKNNELDSGASNGNGASASDHELKREGPVKLSLSAKPKAKPDTTKTVKPVKKNVFAASTSTNRVSKDPEPKPKMNAFQRIMLQEQRHKSGPSRH